MIRFVAKQINNFHWGTWLAAKLQFLFTVMIFIRVYDLPLWVTISAIPVIFAALWLGGYCFIKLGFRDEYQKYEFGAVISETTKNLKKGNSRA